MGALLFTMVLAAGIAVEKIDFPRRQEIMVLTALFTLLGLFLLALYGFVSNRQPTVKVINFLARFGRKTRFGRWRRRLARLRTRAEEMEHVIHTAFTKRWRTFLLAQAITTFSALSVLVRPWLYFHFSAQHSFVPFEKLSAIYIVTNLINMLPHTPGALGVMEYGMGGLFKLLHLVVESDAAEESGVAKNQGAFRLMQDQVIMILGTKTWRFHPQPASHAEMDSYPAPNVFASPDSFGVAARKFEQHLFPPGERAKETATD